jgi:hypothetical protein
MAWGAMRRISRRDNGGPRLDDYSGPAWKGGDPHKFLNWRNAHTKAWKPKSRDVALFRLSKAEAVGLTYEEYTLELLERGRHLSAADEERVATIKSERKRRRFKHLG